MGGSRKAWNRVGSILFFCIIMKELEMKQMESISCGKWTAEDWVCAGGMGAASLVWTWAVAAAGVSAGASVAVAAAWLGISAAVCSQV